MENSDKTSDKTIESTPPDIFGSWKNLYLLVIGNLLIMILVFYIITITIS